MKLIFFRKILYGLIAGAAVTGALLLIFALVLSKQDDPNQNLKVFSLISLLAGAMIGGKVATTQMEARALQGLFFGLVFTLMILLPSTIMSDFDGFSVIKMLLCVVLAFTGAMIGKKTRSSGNSARRRKNVMKRYAR